MSFDNDNEIKDIWANMGTEPYLIYEPLRDEFGNQVKGAMTDDEFERLMRSTSYMYHTPENNGLYIALVWVAIGLLVFGWML